MSDNLYTSARATVAAELLARSLGNPNLQDLTALAAARMGTTHAAINLMTDKAVAVVSVGDNGVAAGHRASFDQSYCVHVLRSDEGVLIPDATVDARVSSTEAAQTGIARSYLGAPLRTADGMVVGALCVYDSQPRDWNERDLQELDELAGQAITVMQRVAARV
jgi:GAF domain-containing protein